MPGGCDNSSWRPNQWANDLIHKVDSRPVSDQTGRCLFRVTPLVQTDFGADGNGLSDVPSDAKGGT